MKTIKSYMLALAAVAASAAVMTTLPACSDDFETPEAVEPTTDLVPNTTIAELKKRFWQGDFNYVTKVPANKDGSHVIIHGWVTSSDEESNFYKNLVIQDETAAITMSINSYNLYLRYRRGQEIVLDMTDMYIGKYRGLQQLGMPEEYFQGNTDQASFMSPEFFQIHAHLKGYPDLSKIDTLAVDNFDEFNTNPSNVRKYQSRLVRFRNVSFVNGGKALFSAWHTSDNDLQNQNITDSRGNQIPVRTSGYSTFWNNVLPTGVGDVVAVASYYQNSANPKSSPWQLVLIDLEGCIGFAEPKGDITNPYTVDDVVQLEAAGQTGTGWVKGYIVGAPNIDVTSITANENIQWEAGEDGFALANTLVIGQTAETREIDHALVIELPSGSVFQTLGNLREHPELLGREILVNATFAKYMDTYGLTGNSGAADSFKIEGVENGDVPDNPDQPVDPGVGSGKSEIKIDFSDPEALGVVKAAPSEATVSDGFTYDGVKVTITQGQGFGLNQELRFFTSAAGVVDFRCSSGGGSKGHTFTVQYGDNIKKIVFTGAYSQQDKNFNFTADPGTFTAPDWTGDSKTVTFTTTGEVHLLSMTIYTDGDGSGDTPVTPPVTGGATVFEETFASGQGQFTIENVVMPDAASYIWTADTQYGYMKASAYISGVSYASDSYLISPAVNLSGATGCKISFEHVFNKFPDLAFAKANCTLCVREVGSTDWTAVPIPNTSDNTAWKPFANSGDIDLSRWDGKNIQFAFRYVSEEGKSGTWEVKNVKLTKAN